MAGKILQGITWAHSRGYTPLVAASQRFSELNPGTEISWTKRSLQEFADFPIEQLTGAFDLLIIDHPWVGCAAATGCVLPLEQYLEPAYLQDQQQNTTGASHASYNYHGSQWALAIDAATPVASYRTDLLKQHRTALPQTWQDVMDLAKEGKVAAPAIPVDLLMNFYMFCIAYGNPPFTSESELTDMETGLSALDAMCRFYGLLDRDMFACNPIAVAEKMSSTNDYWYCPFSYGYSNYARNGYAAHVLEYTDLVAGANGLLLTSTLGGTGIAVSASSQNRELAIAFARQVASPEWQSTLYIQHGGQPGHKAAWLNNTGNALCNNYFINTLPALERAYVRPRYNGYLFFQDMAGDILHKYLLHGGSATSLLENLNTLYLQSLQQETISY